MIFFLNSNYPSLPTTASERSQKSERDHKSTESGCTRGICEARNDQAAIAALSTSLQESVAASVHTDGQMESTSSRCVPYSRAKWNSARLYNLSRADLIELDDDVLKSFYFTLRYVISLLNIGKHAYSYHFIFELLVSFSP